MIRRLIDDGWSLVIYPEGGRSPDGWGQEFKGGAAYLSGRTGAAVVPVFIDGTGALFGKGAKRLKAGTTKWCSVDRCSPLDGESTRRFAARIEAAVAALGDETLTDFWTARRRAHAKASPSLGGPDHTGWRRQWALTRAPSARHGAGSAGARSGAGPISAEPAQPPSPSRSRRCDVVVRVADVVVQVAEQIGERRLQRARASSLDPVAESGLAVSRRRVPVEPCFGSCRFLGQQLLPAGFLLAGLALEMDRQRFVPGGEPGQRVLDLADARERRAVAPFACAARRSSAVPAAAGRRARRARPLRDRASRRRRGGTS